MRIKSWCKVEVMNSLEVPISWHTAEVLSVNGPSYTVRYDSCSKVGSPSTEVRVPRKFIRPCPPPVQTREIWVVGDLVEVCSYNDDCSWKVARVINILSGDHYLVRLLGCSQELSIHRSGMRRRQYWQDGKWIFLPKGSGNVGAVNSHEPSSSTCHHKLNAQSQLSDRWANVHGGNVCIGLEEMTRLHDSHVISSRSLKRMSPYYSSAVESSAGDSEELRAFETNCKRQRINSSRPLKKVDAVAYRRETLGEKKFKHASINVRSNGYNEMCKQKLDAIFPHFPLRTPEYSDSNSGSSVGSCSAGSDNPNKCGCHFVPDPRTMPDALCSDAESVCHLGDDDSSLSPPPEDGLAETVHRIELHAYRCTLEALYASGPLTWEKQTLLTNLLIELHITHDEHLAELKNLISARTSNCVL